MNGNFLTRIHTYTYIHTEQKLQDSGNVLKRFDRKCDGYKAMVTIVEEKKMASAVTVRDIQQKRKRDTSFW